MRKGATPHGGEYPEGGSPPSRDQESGFVVPEQFAGYALRDPLGREIGKVEKVFVNGTGGAEYVAVTIGSFWQKKSVLIPVESISVDDVERTLALR